MRDDKAVLDQPIAVVAAVGVGEYHGVTSWRQLGDAEVGEGRAYYRCLCFKVYVRFTGPEGEPSEPVEVGDGGFTDWTTKLLGNRKERLLISGHGLDRLAIMSRPSSIRAGGS